ncbi:MAG: hypothetical protein VR64_14930 [Desulfatitalea sp. BRH_c12]|nr:MAG: hypothetical protein VR64_14930 [Desulfatitalea sp. BRH_c12]
MLSGSKFARSADVALGGGGIRTFSFKALSPGTTNLHFVLKRSWEPLQSAVDQFQTTVHVRAKKG